MQSDNNNIGAKYITSYHPGGGETICPPPMAVRSGYTSVCGRVRSQHMAKLQAASVPIA